LGWSGGSWGLDDDVAVDVHFEAGGGDGADLEARRDVDAHQQRHGLGLDVGFEQGAVGGGEREPRGGEAHGERFVLAVAVVESGDDRVVEHLAQVGRVDADGVVFDADLGVPVVRHDGVAGRGVEGVAGGTVRELGDVNIADVVDRGVDGPQHQPDDERGDAEPDGGHGDAPREAAAPRPYARRPTLLPRRFLRRRRRQRRRVRLVQLREVERLGRRRERPRKTTVRERPRHVAY
jgi:hypothetical protein